MGQQWFVLPMGVGACAMALFGLRRLLGFPPAAVAAGLAVLAVVALVMVGWSELAPDSNAGHARADAGC